MTTYQEFLASKVRSSKKFGFKPESLPNVLFPFQAHIVSRALEHGRYAIFAECGLGKTLMQLAFAHEVVNRTGGNALILAPLAVSGQTIEEGQKFGLPVSKFSESGDGVMITNYEQLGNISEEFISNLQCIVLDESSILKNFTGKTKKLLIDTFQDTPYRLACTATPAPNDLNEIGNHSEFLGLLDAQDMRARWFVRDEGMNNYRLKGHAKKDFYGWISSWSTMIVNPADIGFDGSGYNLPPLNYHEIEVKVSKKDNGLLFNNESVNATGFNQALRETKHERIEAAAEIVNNSDENFIVWVNQNEEEELALQLIPGAVAVRGSMPADKKEELLLGFAHGDFRVLVTKKKIAQFGLNYQNTNNQVFASLDFSFEGLYQAIRRSYRFGQKKPVNIYLITTDTMGNVKSTIYEKQRQFEEMQTEMNKTINQVHHGLKLGYEREEVKGNNFTFIRGDSCQEMPKIESNSIDFSIFSPPFSTLFTYSDQVEDLGNCESDEEFFQQYEFILRELYRIMKPGRLVAVHTKDIARYKNSDGFSGMWNFTGKNHDLMESVGFKYHCRVTIWTDPVLEQQRTKTQRLLYKQLRKDSTYSGVGMPEYLTIFRKWEGDESTWEPVSNKNTENFPLDTWQKWASPVWMDIQRTDVLNNHKAATDPKDEKHIAPLQLSVIERAVYMWSNPGELVFTPFGGIGSEPYQSILCNRRALAIELKKGYFDTGVKNCRNAELQKMQLALPLL